MYRVGLVIGLESFSVRCGGIHMYIVRQVFRNDFTMNYKEGDIVFISSSKRLARLHKDSLVNSIHDPDSNIEYWLERVQ